MKIHNELLELRQKEKRITSEILTKLQEMENRRGYLDMGYNSLFDYLVRGLGYSEATAYQRQACVRLVKEVPEIKGNLGEDFITVTPGIRVQQVQNDQSRVATLKEASKNGSDYIVLGREITASENISKMIKKVESYIIQNNE